MTGGPPSRRLLLAGALAGGALAWRPRRLLAESPPPFDLPSRAANRRFSIFFRGRKVGAHLIASARQGDATQVATEIDLLIKALVFTVYAFSHRSEETWRDGRLVALRSETVERGERLTVTGAAVPHGFRVVGRRGPFIAQADALTSNCLWTPAALARATLIDAQFGGVIGVSARKLADEELTVAGAPVRARRYRFISPHVAGSIWYDERDCWVRGEFEQDGATVEYRLDPESIAEAPP